MSVIEACSFLLITVNVASALSIGAMFLFFLIQLKLYHQNAYQQILLTFSRLKSKTRNPTCNVRTENLLSQCEKCDSQTESQAALLFIQTSTKRLCVFPCVVIVSFFLFLHMCERSVAAGIAHYHASCWFLRIIQECKWCIIFYITCLLQ